MVPKAHEMMIDRLRERIPELNYTRTVPIMERRRILGIPVGAPKQTGTKPQIETIQLKWHPTMWELTPSQELGTVFIKPISSGERPITDVPANDPSGHGGQRYLSKHDLSLAEMRSAVNASGLRVAKPREKMGPASGKVEVEKTGTHHVTTLRLQSDEEVPSNADVAQTAGKLHLSKEMKFRLRAMLDEVQQGSGLQCRIEDVEEHGKRYTVVHIL